ncbi:MAG: hypothetical protein NT040_17300 [Bacteroidetes bacterium]|nr:hypothetical protein [Bacteroidota bacterium]
MKQYALSAAITLPIKLMSGPGILDDLLLVEMSRRNTDLVADLVCQKPELFEELFRTFANNTEPVSRRAAWVIDTVSEKHPELIAPHLLEIIDLLPTFRHDGLKRHSMRILARSPLPSESHLGKLIMISFEWLLETSEAIAAKIYCMDILYRISQIEPDLKKELADSIEWRMNEETAGFKNRGQKMLKKLYFEINNSMKP